MARPSKEVPQGLAEDRLAGGVDRRPGALLDKEKDLARQRDRLNTERRELPMVEVTKPYEFEGPDGTRSLLDLFEGRPQLIVYHFMFHPEWDDGCPSCRHRRAVAGLIEHPNTRDTTYALVSRAPGQTRAVEDQEGLDDPVVLHQRRRLQLRLLRHHRRLTRLRRVQPPHPRRIRRQGPREHEDRRSALRHAGPHVLPRRGRHRVPHVLGLRPRAGEHRRLPLFPQPHRSDVKRTGSSPLAVPPTPAATSPTSRPNRSPDRSSESLRHTTAPRPDSPSAPLQLTENQPACPPIASGNRDAPCPRMPGIPAILKFAGDMFGARGAARWLNGVDGSRGPEVWASVTPNAEYGRADRSGGAIRQLVAESRLQNDATPIDGDALPSATVAVRPQRRQAPSPEASPPRPRRSERMPPTGVRYPRLRIPDGRVRAITGSLALPNAGDRRSVADACLPAGDERQFGVRSIRRAHQRPAAPRRPIAEYGCN
jgi:Bacterial protein of unknown function (DUF899)